MLVFEAENPRESKEVDSFKTHARGACLRPYNDFCNLHT